MAQPTLLFLPVGIVKIKMIPSAPSLCDYGGTTYISGMFLPLMQI